MGTEKLNLDDDFDDKSTLSRIKAISDSKKVGFFESCWLYLTGDQQAKIDAQKISQNAQAKDLVKRLSVKKITSGIYGKIGECKLDVNANPKKTQQQLVQEVLKKVNGQKSSLVYDSIVLDQKVSMFNLVWEIRSKLIINRKTVQRKNLKKVKQH